MAQISIDIPNGLLSRVVDAVASEYNYNSVTDGTKAAFAKSQVIKFLKRTVRDYEVSQQNKINANSISQDVDANVTIS